VINAYHVDASSLLVIGFPGLLLFLGQKMIIESAIYIQEEKKIRIVL